MELNSKETMSKAENKAKASLFGQMAAPTQVSFQTITFTEKESTNGQTVEFSKANGKITKCMAKVYSLGLMVEFMKASTSMTRKKVKAFSNGQMADNTLESGKEANSMVKEFMFLQKDKKEKEFGNVGSGHSGLTDKRTNLILMIKHSLRRGP